MSAGGEQSSSWLLVIVFLKSMTVIVQGCGHSQPSGALLRLF